MKTKKFIWILVVIIAVTVFGGRAWYLQKQSVKEKDVVKIGAMVPISGPIAVEGQKVVNALNLLAEKMNASRDVKVKFIYEDDKYTAKDSISAFRKLRSQGVDLFFVFGDLPVKTILSLAEEQKIPLFAMAESADLNASPVVVSISPACFHWMDAMSSFVKETLKPKNLVIIYQKDIAHLEQIRILKENFKGMIPTVHEEQFNPDSLEVRSVVTKALSYNPDVVIVTGFGPTYAAILNTVREQGFTGPLVSDANVSLIKENLAKTPYPFYWVDTLFDDNTDIPEMRAFIDEFQKRFGVKPFTFTMISYVGGQAIINAIETADYEPMDVLNKIQQTKDLDTVLGPLTIDKTKWMKVPIVIKQMQPDGTAKVIKQ